MLFYNFLVAHSQNSQCVQEEEELTIIISFIIQCLLKPEANVSYREYKIGKETLKHVIPPSERQRVTHELKWSATIIKHSSVVV